MNTDERTFSEKHMMEHHHCCGPLSWTGVIAGALVGIGLSFLIGLFDVAIGLSVVKYSNEGVATVVIGGLLGMIVGAIATMFVSGWVAGYLGRKHCSNEHLGVLHGFTSWCLSLVIMFALFAPHAGALTFGSQLLANYAHHHSAIHTTTNVNAPTMSTTTDNNSDVTINTQKATNEIGLGTLVTFLIFFLGAVASCFGGYCAVACKTMCCGSKDKKPDQTL